MRYVALVDGERAALAGFGSSALYMRPREWLLAWSDSQRHFRLRFINDNRTIKGSCDTRSDGADGLGGRRVGRRRRQPSPEPKPKAAAHPGVCRW